MTLKITVCWRTYLTKYLNFRCPFSRMNVTSTVKRCPSNRSNNKSRVLHKKFIHNINPLRGIFMKIPTAEKLFQFYLISSGQTLEAEQGILYLYMIIGKFYS